MRTKMGYINVAVEPSETYDKDAVRAVLRSLFNYHMRPARTMSEKREARNRIEKMVELHLVNICKQSAEEGELARLPQVEIKRAFELEDEFLNSAAIFVHLGSVNAADQFVPLSPIEKEALRSQLN